MICNKIVIRLLRPIGALILVAVPPMVQAANSISIGQVQLDEPTIKTLGIVVSVSGDDDHNATATLRYRRHGTTTWRQALPPMRVRTDTFQFQTEDPPIAYGFQWQPDAFAGSVFHLAPSTTYEIEVTITDPDGGGGVTSAFATTRAVPRADPANPRIVNVSDTAGLVSALENAQPGDVITLANGVYTRQQGFSITASGTVLNPIFIRGQSRAGVVLEEQENAGTVLTISGSFVTVEDLSIRARGPGSLGIAITSGSNVTIRRNKITGIAQVGSSSGGAISASGGTQLRHYICDNTIIGGWTWGSDLRSTWGYFGIDVTGRGHVICYNTISGVGDSIGFKRDADQTVRAVDIYGNDISAGGDDGIEMDWCEGNCRAFDNRVTNSYTCVSFQPVWGGPAYAFRNLCYNIVRGPWKMNNDPSGIYVMHNTVVKGEWTWKQYGSTEISNVHMFNNILVGDINAVDMSADLIASELDYNGWRPDGQFRFGNSIWWDNFSELQTNSPFEKNGRLLGNDIFENAITVPPDYPNNRYDPPAMSLSSSSSALDAGRVLPNVNDDYTGSAADLGALERGKPIPIYGVRATVSPAPGSRPSPPTGLQVQ